MLKWHKARIDITMDQGSQTHKHCGLQVSAEGLLYGFVKWKRDKKRNLSDCSPAGLEEFWESPTFAGENM